MATRDITFGLPPEIEPADSECEEEESPDLMSLFITPEGETVTQILSGIRSSIQQQNKILMKLGSVISQMKHT